MTFFQTEGDFPDDVFPYPAPPAGPRPQWSRPAAPPGRGAVPPPGSGLLSPPGRGVPLRRVGNPLDILAPDGSDLGTLLAPQEVTVAGQQVSSSSSMGREAALAVKETKQPAVTAA